MNPGIAYAALAFILWGVAPLYFKQIASVDAFEIVLHRSLWAMLFLLGVLAATRRWAWWGQALRQPRLLAVTALSALLLSGNWTLFVWSVNNGHVIDASLGYFINPLIYVLLGFVVLRERLRPLQWAAVGIAGLGVAWLTWLAGHPPWIALTLAFSLFAAVVVFAFGEEVIGIFLDNPSPTVMEAAHLYILYTVPVYFFLSQIFIYRNACQGMGVSMIPMLSGVVELIMRSIAAIYLSVPFGYEGICMAEPIAWISCAVFVFAAYHYFVRLLEKKYTPVD